MARSATCIISEETSSGSTALASSLQIPLNKNLAPTAQSGRPSELVCGCRCVAIVVAQRVTQRGWCRKRMQPRCVCEHMGGKSTGRRRTNQQREQQQQQRTAGGKVSPRETLPPESVMGAAQHKTLGAAPCRARGRESTCRSATRGKSR